MRDTETQSTAGQSGEAAEGGRKRLTYLFILIDIHQIESSNVPVVGITDIISLVCNVIINYK